MKNDFYQALKIFQTTAKTVPAYKKLLNKFKIQPSQITNGQDFKNLPILDKKTYIHKFQLNQLIPKGNFPPITYASSGSTGKTTFWFRNQPQEKYAGDAHETIVKDIFHINKKDSTLVIICFSMGVWVAGNSEAAGFRTLSERGYNFTIITPGIEKNDIVNIFKTIAPFFKHIILAGYPPFISDLLHTLKDKQINLKTVKILTAGENFTEHWRETVMSLTDNHHPDNIINVYGCADAGMLGFETPLSIFIRKQTKNNPQLFKTLFGECQTEPALVQYNPNQVFFEEHKGELMFTINSGIPLVRYNIHDTGKVFSYFELCNILKKFNLLKEAKKAKLNKWPMPFLIKDGRTDVAVTFYALNIYPEHLRAGIEDKRIAKMLSGNFLSYNTDKQNHKIHQLHLILELAPNKHPNKKIYKLFQKVIVEHLLQENIEYRKLFNTIGNKAIPIIQLKKHGTLNAKFGLFYQTGKKPKIIS
jgi:phenylacetate-CoA ligase